MPYMESPLESPPESYKQVKKIRKLVLCFDGTGNTFNGNTSDTNVVKIYDKLDRLDDSQYHYYQPGIGTYDISGGSINKSKLGYARSKISKVIDQGIATSFDAHVMAGYKFIMNHFKPGAKIYMFGFSRGAFTARFLARMINTIGLLSKGNDEMIPFAYSLYQDHEQATTIEQEFCKGGNHSRGSTEGTPLLNPILNDAENAKHKLENFKSTFCRKDKIYHPGNPEPEVLDIKVYFLGMFDCVSSVAVLETPFGQTPKPVSVIGTAEHVRHAVAVDEFRVKFKAALLSQDIPHKSSENDEDIKEVWFPGNHGDVGGGWPAHNTEDPSLSGKWKQFTTKIKRFFFKDSISAATKEAKYDSYQMSDIPLSWMIRELELIGAKEEAYKLQWSERLDGFKKNFKEEQALNARRHNTTSFSRGSSWLIVLMWKFMEYVPLFPRYELDKGEWKMRTWPPNMANARDIPKNALLHASLHSRITDKDRIADETGTIAESGTTAESRSTAWKKKPYKPRNNHGAAPPCLEAKNFIEIDVYEDKHGHNVNHTLWALDQDTVKTYKENRRKEHTHNNPVAKLSNTTR